MTEMHIIYTESIKRSFPLSILYVKITEESPTDLSPCTDNNVIKVGPQDNTPIDEIE